MNSPLFNASKYLIEIFNILLVGFSLVVSFQKEKPGYMRSFLVYAIGNELAEVSAMVTSSSKTIGYGIFTAFELLYFVYFLSQLIESRKIIKLNWCLSAIFLALFLAYEFHKIYFGGGWLLVFESAILISLCLAYFTELYLKPTDLNLWNEPAFWMVTGILFYFACLIPILFFTGYFVSKGDVYMAFNIYSVNNYAQIVSYLLFFKAMTCRIGHL